MIGKWTDYLPPYTYNRLCECRNTKKDTKTLVDTRWWYMKEIGKDREGFTKEDALVYILDLLDSNSQYIDLTREEYDELRKE